MPPDQTSITTKPVYVCLECHIEYDERSQSVARCTRCTTPIVNLNTEGARLVRERSGRLF